MDPAVSMIVSAIVAGSSAVAKDAVSSSIRSVYESLKDRVQGRLRGDSAAETALVEAAKDPETWEKPLAKAVADHRLGEDEAVLSLAQELLELIQESQPSGTTKYNIKIDRGQGVVIGDDANVRMSFGGSTSEDSGPED